MTDEKTEERDHTMTAPERAFLMACLDSSVSYLVLAKAEPLDALRWIEESEKWLARAKAARGGELEGFEAPKSLEVEPRSPLPSRQPDGA